MKDNRIIFDHDTTAKRMDRFDSVVTEYVKPSGGIPQTDLEQTVQNKLDKDSIMICTLAPDLVKFAGTKWQFLNAVADHVGHSKPMRKTDRWKENRWGSIMSGNALMDLAMRTVAA